MNNKPKIDLTTVRIKDAERARKTRANRKNDPERLARWNKYKREYRKRKTKSPGARFKHRLMNVHSISVDAYELLIKFQEDKCAICGRSEEGLDPFRKKGRLSVDHDHGCCPKAGSCGKCVRGLLCSKCNTAIGGMGDDPERLRRAADYIERGGTGDMKLILMGGI